VLGGAGEAHTEWLRKFADRFLAEREAGEHPATGRIRKRVKGHIESIFNHKVEYRLVSLDCQPFG
jgi:hypothetical protein